MLRSIPGFYPLDASISTQVRRHSCLYTIVIIENISDFAKCPLGKGIQNKPGLRYTALEMLENDRKFHQTYTFISARQQPCGSWTLLLRRDSYRKYKSDLGPSKSLENILPSPLQPHLPYIQCRIQKSKVCWQDILGYSHIQIVCGHFKWHWRKCHIIEPFSFEFIIHFLKHI